MPANDSRTRTSRNAVFSNNKSVDSRFSKNMQLKKQPGPLPPLDEKMINLKKGSQPHQPQKVKLDLAAIATP